MMFTERLVQLLYLCVHQIFPLLIKEQTFNSLASPFLFVYFFSLHVTHVTCDMWHVTHETQGVVNIFQNVSFLALTAWDIQSLEDISTNHQLVNPLIN